MLLKGRAKERGSSTLDTAQPTFGRVRSLAFHRDILSSLPQSILCSQITASTLVQAAIMPSLVL